MSELRRRMIREMQLRNLSPGTQAGYVATVARLAGHYKRSPDRITGQEIEDCVIYLLVKRRLAPGSCCSIVTAIRFFYTVTLGWDPGRMDLPPIKRGSRLPEILSKEELARVLVAPAKAKHRALLMTAYAAGLRAGEVTSSNPHSQRPTRRRPVPRSGPRSSSLMRNAPHLASNTIRTANSFLPTACRLAASETPVAPGGLHSPATADSALYP